MLLSAVREGDCEPIKLQWIRVLSRFRSRPSGSVSVPLSRFYPASVPAGWQAWVFLERPVFMYMCRSPTLYHFAQTLSLLFHAPRFVRLPFSLPGLPSVEA